MKLYNKPPKKNTKTMELKKVVHAFQLLTTAMETTLRTNGVISEKELETIVSNSSETLDVLKEVLARTEQTLNETSDLHRESDISLGVKLERQQTDVLYMVDVATTMLERLYNLRHITTKEHASLVRYWRSIPVQHQLLSKRWERARNT